VVSSTSIKVPSITEMAMIHGLMAGFVDSVIELCCCQTSLAIGSKLSDISLLLAAQRVRASRHSLLTQGHETVLLIANC